VERAEIGFKLKLTGLELIGLVRKNNSCKGLQEPLLALMDTYLDPSLGGPLAFLDSSAQLHAPSDPSNQPLNPFDYDSWLNPVTVPSYDGTSGLSVTHGAPPAAALGLDGRGSLSSAHFGVHLHSEPSVHTKSSSAPLSPMSPAVNSSSAMHLSFAGSDYSDGMFHTRPNLNSSQGYAHPSPSHLTPGSTSTHSEPGTESMSIAMYDRQIAGGSGGGGGGTPRDVVGDYSASLRESSTTSSRSALSPSAPNSIQHSPARRGSQPRSESLSLQQAAIRGNGQSPPTTRSRGSRVPQADESVPEAALHLLRLALPTGSTGSTATNTTGDDDDRSCDEDAEGESDDTSIHSTDLKALSKLFPDGTRGSALPSPFETTVWNHAEDQPPLHIQRGGGPGSRRPSAASSAASTRIRQHNPARTQREASISSNRSRLGSEAPSLSTSTSAAIASSSAMSPKVAASGPAAAVGRRSAARGRKSIANSLAEESDGGESEGEYNEGDVYEDGDATDTGKGKGKKKAGKGGAAGAKGKGKATKRASNANDAGPPVKKQRTNTARNSSQTPLEPRKPRRQAYIPPNLRNRTFPPQVEISSSFPRFYRSFPISSAIPPDSYVLLPAASLTPANKKTNNKSRSVIQASQPNPLDVLPTPPTPIYEQFGAFGGHSPYSSHTPPLASTSTSGNSLPNISVDANGSFVIHDSSHAHPHVHPHAQFAHYPHGAYSLPPNTPSSHAMSPPPLPQHSPAASQSSQGSSMNALVPSLASLTLMQPPPEARWNKSGDPFNLYYPRFVKGSSDEKCGLCPICSEPPERGGEGEHKWLKVCPHLVNLVTRTIT